MKTDKTDMRGFSLIELLIVVALLGGLSIAISRTFFSQLKGTEKSQRLLKIRQTGDQALLLMKKKIRNAREVVDSTTYCDGSYKTSIAVVSRNPTSTGFAASKSITTTFTCSTNRILMQEVENDTGNETLNSYITPDTFNITNCSQVFLCEKAIDSPAKVTVSFNLEEPDTGDNFNFSSTISLRNY